MGSDTRIDVLVIVCLFLLPFLAVGMLRAVMTLDQKEKGFGPLPWCFAIGLTLTIIWIGTFS